MIEMRTSERSTFHRCPKRWYWSVVERLAPRQEANPLWFGQAVHIALAEWYKKGTDRGPHPAETFLKVLNDPKFKSNIRSGSEEWEVEYVDARELGREMLENYIVEYGRDEHKHYIATEKTGYVWLPDLSGLRRQIKYWFTFDGVFRDLRDGFIKMDEHKTAATIVTSHLPIDQQAGSYWAVVAGKLQRAGLMEPGEHIDAIEYNFLRKAKKDQRPKNMLGQHTNRPLKEDFIAAFEAAEIPEQLWKPGSKYISMDAMAKLAYRENMKVLGKVSKSQPLPLFERVPIFRTPEERKSQLLRIREDAWHIEQARNNPAYPIVKNVVTTGPLACQHCPFFRMCVLDEQGDQESVEDFKKAMYIKRDPYAAYRKAA